MLWKLDIIRLMRDYEPYFTEDGSIGLYSFVDKDVYHSKYGALTEAWEKFIIPSGLKNDIEDNKNIKVLDVCYGIGYNTKALMSFVINKKQKQLLKKNLFQKIFCFIKCIISIVSLCVNNVIRKARGLSLRNASIHNNNSEQLPHVKVDCLDINEELVQLSPLFRTVKTPYEIYSQFVPEVFDCLEVYYTIREHFANFISRFAPKNRKEIKELLDLRFKIMHLDKEYRVNGMVNYMILNKLAEIYGKDYPDKNIKKIVKEKANRRFFDKSLIKYARFNQKWGYKTLSKINLSAFLHNIYYNHLSRRYKKVDFKAAQSLFELNFHIKDARKTILEISDQYDYVFLDAFTYTKAPQLWTMEFIAELYNRMAPQGVLLTYSTSAQVRNTLLENKFYVGKIYNPKTKRFIGTIASKDKAKIKYPLNNYEIGLCNTKAGIPYYDPNLCFSNKEIIELREYEFRHSTLMSSSKYMKLRTLRSENEEI